MALHALPTVSQPYSGHAPALVGRERELAVLRDCLAASIAGRGGVVLISGEAGIGKTALAEAFGREASETGVRVLTGYCYDRTETPPYGPWIAGWRRANLAPADTMPAPPSPEVATSQEAFVGRVGAFFAALAAIRPLVVTLEDLHWADLASLDLLRSLARSLADLPLLIVATYRSDELGRHHPLTALIPQLVREASAVRLDLHPLDTAAAHALVALRYDLPASETARLATYLITRTEGNALFIAELLRTLEEVGALRREGNRWTLGDLSRTPVPLLLQQTIDARLARLGDTADALLAIAAVIGHEVPLAIWGAVAGVDEELLMVTSERAEAANLVVAWTSGEGVRFTHALIREALYENVPALRRRRLHGHVADALAARPFPDPDAVAYHLQQAGDRRAADWLIAAGERAEGTFAYRTAVARYEAALAHLDAAHGDPLASGWLRLRVALLIRYEDPGTAMAAVIAVLAAARQGDGPRLEAHARLAHGYLLCMNGEVRTGLVEARAGAAALDTLPPASAEEHAREAPFAGTLNAGMVFLLGATVGNLAEARAEGERFLSAVATPPVTAAEAARGAPVWGYMAIVYAMQGELALAQRADDSARIAYALLERSRLAVPLARSTYAQIVLPYLMDDGAEREQIVSEAELLVRRGLGTRLPDQDIDPARVVWLQLLFVEGRWEEARTLAEALRPIFHSGEVVRLLNLTMGPLARAQGDPAQAWRLIAETFPDGALTAPGNMNYIFTLPLQRLAVALALDSGELTVARDWLAAHDRWLEWSGATLGRAEGLALRAEYARATGAPAEARNYAEHALVGATVPRQPLVLLAAHRLLGELETAAGRLAAAHTHLTAALALAEGCRAPYERALTLLAYAELLGARQDGAMAADVLETVRALCLPLDARPALARADTLATRLTQTQGQRTPLPDGLTAREVEVLGLVAAGLDYATIAEQLFLSRHTIKAHVANIFGKIGVTNRAAATRFAVDHGLV